MAHWGGGGGGFGGGGLGGALGMGGANQWRRAADGWQDEALGKAYDHTVVTRLVRYLLPYRRHIILALLGTVLFALASYTQPVLVGMAIDSAVQGNLRQLSWVGLAFVALALVAWVSYYLFMSTTAWLGHRVLYTLRTQMFDHLEKLSLSFYDKQEVGRVMSRVQNDVTSIQELLTSGFFAILADVLGLGVVVFWLLERDVVMALIAMAVVPLLLLSLVIWQRRAIGAFIRVRAAIARVNANLQENISGARVIQSLNREDENLRRFDEVNASHLQANVEAGRLSAA